MNTNRLKKFAQQARLKLLDQVNSRMELVLNTDSAELREKANAVRQLKEAIADSSKEQVIDKVAYTWFNRFMALRFMDVNGYQPLKLQVVSPKEGFTLSELLEDAIKGQVPEELPVKRQHIFDLLDGKIPSSNPQNEIYKELLIAACNHLHSVFPYLFEKINDYTELLLPDDLTSEFSILHDFLEGMQEEDCRAVEVIGWLYQFYISEKKDEVFASKGKVKKEEIPAATQLFTPRWIVEYMVQNTVGKLWLQNNPNSSLRVHMPYFIESPSVTAEDYLKINSVEEITLLDQACGSGHILVYGFELLSKIYEEEGYTPSEIPQLIIKKNLFGFEIDERAAQLAGFALMMKAREYHRRVFRKEIVPNILCFEDVGFTEEELQQVLKTVSFDDAEAFKRDLKLLENATNFGSLIIPETSPDLLQNALTQVEEELKKADFFEQHLLEKLQTSVKQLLPLSKKYNSIVNNPPYMGKGKMNSLLTKFISKNYSKGKADLSTCFIQSAMKTCKKGGLISMVTLDSWMFLTSFDKFRELIIRNINLDTMIHIGWNCFPFGHVYNRGTAFVFQNSLTESKGVFINLSNVSALIDKQQLFEKRLKNGSNRYERALGIFNKLPESTFAYWLSETTISNFENKNIGSIGSSSAGIRTGKDDAFIKYWNEINFSEIKFNSQNKTALIGDYKWFPITRGGEFRKWYGNEWYVIYGENDFLRVKDLCSDYRLRDSNQYFQEGITWTMITSANTGFRMCNKGVLFGNGGPVLFIEDVKTILGYLNSEVAKFYLDFLNPTINYTKSDIEKLPLIPKEIDVEELVDQAILISKEDWNSNEHSWGFKRNELIRFKRNDLKQSLHSYKTFWKEKFTLLHKIEEEINKKFIALHKLEGKLTSEIPLKDITILRDVTHLKKEELKFKEKEIVLQLLSYAVGCMFGRYSLDEEGLILANQGETLQDYLQKLQESNSKFQSIEDLIFVPDEDNIIPVLDDEWFEDDIVGRFYDFLKASFGKENFDKNLAFVEECLGRDIRSYFVKDFYKDHIKRYKKRPIYWMFSSPKGNFNVLIYLHRYTQDTLNNILNGYLLEYKEKLKARMEHLDHIIETGSSTEQNKAGKEKDKLKLILLELQEYEREILYPLATQRIFIDLDDGVLVNYNKFGKAIKEVKGLNDAKTKKKVKGFDWIETKTII